MIFQSPPVRLLLAGVFLRRFGRRLFYFFCPLFGLSGQGLSFFRACDFQSNTGTRLLKRRKVWLRGRLLGLGKLGARPMFFRQFRALIF